MAILEKLKVFGEQVGVGVAMGVAAAPGPPSGFHGRDRPEPPAPGRGAADGGGAAWWTTIQFGPPEAAGDGRADEPERADEDRPRAPHPDSKAGTSRSAASCLIRVTPVSSDVRPATLAPAVVLPGPPRPIVGGRVRAYARARQPRVSFPSDRRRPDRLVTRWHVSGREEGR